MATGRPDMKRWPRHKSGPKRGRMMSYEELREAGKKPVYLTTQSDLFEDEPRKAKPRKRKSKPSATAALKRAQKAAAETKKQSEERAERARTRKTKSRATESAERAGEYSGIFGALSRLWHGED